MKIVLDKEKTPNAIGSNEIAAFGTPQESNTALPGKIVVAGYGLPDHVQSLDDTVIEYIKDLGFNTFIVNFEDESGGSLEKKISASFTKVNKANLRMIVGLECENNTLDLTNQSQQWIKTLNSWGEVVSKFKEEKNLAGWYLCNQPSFSVFWMLSQFKDNILALYEKHNNEIKEKPNIQKEPIVTPNIFTNLYSKMSLQQANGVIKAMALQGYPKIINMELDSVTGENEAEWADDYYNKYLSAFNPNLWCYDCLAFVPEAIDGKMHPYNPVMDENFLRSLTRIKNMSAKSTNANSSVNPDDKQCHFWANIKISYGKHTPQNASPTLVTIRFTTFCALAFGAKGILFGDIFKTVDISEITPGNDPDSQFIPKAPILYISGLNNDPENKYYIEETNIYSIVKNVNEEISAVSSTLAECSFVDGGVYPKKPNDNDKGIDVLTMPFGNITSVQGSGKGFIITMLKNNEGKDVYIVINQDCENYQEVTVEFDKYMMCSKIPMSKFKLIYLILEAGDWLVFTEA